MTTPDLAAWRRLGQAVVKRRTELRLTQGDIPGRGGPSMPTVHSIEGAKATQYRPRTLADLERALNWRSGSVDAVLAGGDPMPADPTMDAHGARVIASILEDPNLLPEAKQHLVNQYGLLLRLQGAPALSPAASPEPVTEGERAFVEQGQGDLEASGLHLVDNGDTTCQ